MNAAIRTVNMKTQFFLQCEWDVYSAAVFTRNGAINSFEDFEGTQIVAVAKESFTN